MLDTLKETINNSEPFGIPNITNNLINNVEVDQPNLEMSMGSSDGGELNYALNYRIFFSHAFALVVKFGFSEKATKFEKIFVVLLTRLSCSVRVRADLSKSRQIFFKTNVAKLY